MFGECDVQSFTPLKGAINLNLWVIQDLQQELFEQLAPQEKMSHAERYRVAEF